MQRPNRRGSARKAPNSLTRIPIRLNILMGIVILMLGALGIQLVNLQIRSHTKFVAEITSGTQSVEREKVQRGMIYDTTGKVLVANKGSQAITYNKPKNISEAKMYEIANEVAKYIQIDSTQLSDSNYATYYILDETRNKAVASHIKNVAEIGTDERVRQVTSYVMKHMDEFPLDDQQKNAAMLYQKMANAYSLSTVYLKENDVTADEIANIGERQSKMPGVKVGLYYTRDYPNGDAMQSIIGSVSTSKAGLPDSKVNTLLTQGYERDDNVGTSYLEQYYESTLRGTKKQTAVSTDGKTGENTTDVINAGQAGDSLHLTINAKFQEDIQNILSEKMPGGLTQGAYAVVINPKTGGLYAMGGVYRDSDTGQKTPDALGNINRAQVVGSAVKPAMITTGLMNNVITPQNSNITDVPIQIAATAKKASWFNQNGSFPLTAQTALQNSSNSYVMQLMLKLGGTSYFPNMSLASLNDDVWQKMRNGFARFGLGVRTGIDLPGEIAGLKGPTDDADKGKALDESFGQYDTYTPMQMAQYVATIANGGYRIRPHVVESITQRQENSSIDQLQTTIPTQTLGTVGWTDDQRNVILEGMHLVVHGSGPYVTGASMKTVKPDISAKTGTAETFTKGQSTYSSTAISFVPDGNVAVAVVIPGISAQTDDSVSIPITNAVWQAFWNDVESSGN